MCETSRHAPWKHDSDQDTNDGRYGRDVDEDRRQLGAEVVGLHGGSGSGWPTDQTRERER